MLFGAEMSQSQMERTRDIISPLPPCRVLQLTYLGDLGDDICFLERPVYTKSAMVSCPGCVKRHLLYTMAEVQSGSLSQKRSFRVQTES